MISISKSSPPPSRLINEGRSLRLELERDHEADPEAFKRSIRSSGAFDSKIFSHTSVREQLLDDQNEKCCFCEKGREHVHEVEHFRPKKAVRQRKRDPLEYPGYYWLAYEWSNLLMACRFCNGRKGTLFPLCDPNARAQSHTDELEAEEPLLVQPDKEDPADHIAFREHVAIPLTDRGERTIDVCGLNRDQLRSDRREAFEMISQLLRLAALGLPESDEASQILQRRTQTDSEFSAMVRAALA